MIVVNDSGRSLPEADWQRSEYARVIETNQRERSVARNTGAAIAQGRYLHFLDDDDWLLPNGLAHLRDLSRTSKAAWLYTGSRLVDDKGIPLVELHPNLSGNCFIHVMAGEWIPLQASLISANAFFVSGGFNPLLSAGEDVDLCRRILLRHDVEGIPDVVVCIHTRGEDSSTDYRQLPGLSRSARERILDEAGAFAQMRASANSGYWQGRLVRIYLTSTLWNLQQKKLWVALSRFWIGLWGMSLAGSEILSPDFWRATLHAYQSETFARGFHERVSSQSSHNYGEAERHS